MQTKRKASSFISLFLYTRDLMTDYL